MFSNRYYQKIGCILGILIFISASTFASGDSKAKFHLKVLDRLSLIYLMDGQMEKSIKVQKRAMKIKKKPVVDAAIKEDTNVLISLLKKNKKISEAKKWQLAFAKLGIGKILFSKNKVPDRKNITPEIGPDTKAYEEVTRKSVKKQVASVKPNIKDYKIKTVKESEKKAERVIKFDRIKVEFAKKHPVKRSLGVKPKFVEENNKKIENKPNVPNRAQKLVQARIARAKIINREEKKRRYKNVSIKQVEKTGKIMKRKVIAQKVSKSVAKKRLEARRIPKVVVQRKSPTTKVSKIVAKKRAEVKKAPRVARKKDTERLPIYKLPQPKPAPRELALARIPPQEYNPSKALFPNRVKKLCTIGQNRKSISLSSPTLYTNSLQSLSKIKVSLNFRDAEIADVVRMLAAKGGLNVVSRHPIKGKTTVHFDNINVGLALDIILRTNEYLYDVKDGVVWVFKKGEEPLETKVFFLRNALAADILPMIEQTLQNEHVSSRREAATKSSDSNNSDAGLETTGSTDTAGTSTQTQTQTQNSNSNQDTTSDSSSSSSQTSGTRTSAYLDERSNSIIVTATCSQLNKVAKLLEIYDVQGAARQEERVFKLMYIDIKTLKKAIKMVIPRFDATKQMFEVKRSTKSTSNTSSSSK